LILALGCRNRSSQGQYFGRREDLYRPKKYDLLLKPPTLKLWMSFVNRDEMRCASLEVPISSVLYVSIVAGAAAGWLLAATAIAAAAADLL
jgi:hypothetical protein